METTARSKVVIDSQQAEQALNELTQEAKKYKQAMSDAIKSNDLTAHKKAEQQWKATNKAIKDARVELHSVDEVMKNLSGASMKQLQVAKRSLTAELNKMTRGTDEYIRKSKQLQNVNGEIKKVRGEMYGVSGASEGMFAKLRSGFMWMAGAIGSAMVLWRGFTSTLKTTQTGADSLERTMQGLKGATTGLQQTIATGDWSNLFTNMKNGYLAAAAYADALDELADRMRAVDVRSSEQKAEMEELRNVMASVETESIETREKAQDRYMELNQEILEATQKNADLMIQVERDNLKRQHGLNDEKVELMIDFVRNYDILTENELKNIKKVLDAEKDVAEEKKKVYMGSLSDNIKAAAGQNKVLEELKINAEAEKTMLSEKELAYYDLTLQLDKFIDDQRDNVANALKSVADASAQFETLQRNAVRRQQALEREKKQRAADAQKAELEALDQQYQQILLEIDRAYLEEHNNAEVHNHQLEAAEWAHLEARIAMYRQFGMDTTALERERQKQIIATMEGTKAEYDRINQEYKTQEEKLEEERRQMRVQNYEERKKERKKELDEKKKQMDEELQSFIQKTEQYKQITDQMATSVGSLMGQLASDTEMTSKEVARQVLLIALDTVHAIARMAIAEIWAKSLKSEDSVLTFGATGVARAVIISALVEGAFSGLKAMVMKAGQRYAGKYDVMGESDGRTYRNVPFGGQMKTGIYGRPTLVAERGNELIVDAGTLRNVSLNFPDVLPKIRASMVPQRAAGNVSEATSKGVNTYIDGDMRAAVELFLDSVRLFHHDVKNGIPAKLSYKELSREQSKNAGITNVASK